MAEFEALGRDAVNAANSLDDGTGHLAKAVCAVLAWFGDDGADHLLAVEATKDGDGATVTVSVKERDVYVAPSFVVPDSVAAPHDTPAPEPESVPDVASDPPDEPEAATEPVEAAEGTPADPGTTTTADASDG